MKGWSVPSMFSKLSARTVSPNHPSLLQVTEVNPKEPKAEAENKNTLLRLPQD